MSKCIISVFELKRDFSPEQVIILRKSVAKLNRYFKNKNPQDHTSIDLWYDKKAGLYNITIHPSRKWTNQCWNAVKIYFAACLHQLEMFCDFKLHHVRL